MRAGALLFGGWLLGDGLVLSFMKSNVHPYYSLSLAPAVAGIAAIGAHEMWVRRQSRFGRVGLTALLAVTGIWSWWVLGRNEGWMPALRWNILIGTVLAAAALVLSASRRRRVAVGAAVLGVTAVLAGPTAYAVATLNVAHRGGGPTVGPARPEPAFARAFGQPKDNPELDALLRGAKTKWSAATVGSSTAAGLELSSHTAVMAIGGFTGADPVPSLGQFKCDVSDGQVTYYIVQRDWRGKPGGWPDNRNHSGITDWVSATFASTQVGDTDVFDLTKPK